MSTLASVIGRDTLANRPAASIAGRLFYNTTDSKLQRDNGSSWDDVAETASSAAELLAYKAHTAGDEAITSTTMADLDATNAVVTFTAPASLDVLVRLTAVVQPRQASGAYVSWGLRESTTDIAGANGESIVARAAAANTPEWRAASLAFILMNISSGSHTYKWAAAIDAAGTANQKANSSAPSVMEVWALP